MVLREDDIRRPDGSPGIYGVVDKPDYALVMPYDGHRFRLVEQFRYPLGERRWEFPQGTAPGLADTDPAELAVHWPAAVGSGRTDGPPASRSRSECTLSLRIARLMADSLNPSSAPSARTSKAGVGPFTFR